MDKVNLTNEKGSTKTMATAVWNKVNKGGVYNGFWIHGDQKPSMIAIPKSQKPNVIDNLPKPQFIPQEVINMQNAKTNKLEAEIESLESLFAEHVVPNAASVSSGEMQTETIAGGEAPTISISLLKKGEEPVKEKNTVAQIIVKENPDGSVKQSTSKK